MVTPNTDIVPAEIVPTHSTRTKNFRISGDVIRQTMTLMDNDKHSSDLNWFGQYCRARDLGRAELGRLLKKPNGDFYAYDSLAQTLTGKRLREGSNVDAIMDAIGIFRSVEEAREAQQTSGYIHTRLSDIIWKRCRKALLRGKIGFIFGDSQIGKTEALKEYQKQHNHGETIYIEVPCGANLGSFLREFANVLGIPTGLKQSDLKMRIIAAINNHNLIILDEAHRCFSSRYGTSGLMIFDFMRELYNKTKCGVIISLTNEGRDEFLKGKYAKALKQLWRRRITPLQLPSVTPLDDLALFANAFGLSPATSKSIKVTMNVIDDNGDEQEISHSNNPLKLQQEVIKEDGLGVWISILEDASDMAQEANRKLTWGAVIKAYCLAQAEAQMIQ